LIATLVLTMFKLLAKL